ncbi:uncharacterized protein BXZ73DRAFT_105414 [Epithele typhae]|uniref:uncharacterized protein n=1 Tax=Epithele typhae TaxID=378194 RepID=UPI002007E172|nr:uncharacterized protein BXZ73DRAFT_105414 [Epithele typhae]KAH9917894.1 hypothetical protein BXZ73DRAFT_105414 [Epithele typhae]
MIIKFPSSEPMTDTKLSYNGFPDARAQSSGHLSHPRETVLYPPPPDAPPSYSLSPTSYPTYTYVRSSSSAPPPTPPPQHSFARPRNPAMPCGPFEPLTVLCSGPALAAGFPAYLPPSTTVPHPFGTHDIAEEDWAGFLADVARAGSSVDERWLRAAFAPKYPEHEALGGRGRDGGSLIGQLAELATPKGKKRGTTNPVNDVVGQWNSNFFHHRNIDAAIVLDGPPPAPQAYGQEDYHERRRRGRRRQGLIGGLISAAVEAATQSSAPPSQEHWVLVLRYWQPGMGYLQQQQGYAGGGGFARAY